MLAHSFFIRTLNYSFSCFRSLCIGKASWKKALASSAYRQSPVGLAGFRFFARKIDFSLFLAHWQLSETGVNKRTMTCSHYSGNGGDAARVRPAQRETRTMRDGLWTRNRPWMTLLSLARAFIYTRARRRKQIRYLAASEMLTRVRNEICCSFILLNNAMALYKKITLFRPISFKNFHPENCLHRWASNG